MSRVRSVAYFNKVVYNYCIGRQGQTVDDNVFLKNIWMEAKGVEVMLGQFKQLAGDTANLEYLKQRLRNRCQAIYQKYLIANQHVSFDLRKFDGWLQENAPQLYLDCNEFKLSAFKSMLTSHYVKKWRDHKLNTDITFKIIKNYLAFRQGMTMKRSKPYIVYFD